MKTETAYLWVGVAFVLGFVFGGIVIGGGVKTQIEQEAFDKGLRQYNSKTGEKEWV